MQPGLRHTSECRLWAPLRAWDGVFDSVARVVSDSFARVSADCMRAHNLRYCPGSLALASLLTESENEWLAMQLHKPIAATRVIGHILAACNLEPILFMDLQRHMDTYLGRVGACERILATPIPLAYSRYPPTHVIVRYLHVPGEVLCVCFRGA